MKKLIDIPEKALEKLKKKAFNSNSRSVKKYMEDVLIHHANQVKETKVHFLDNIKTYFNK